MMSLRHVALFAAAFSTMIILQGCTGIAQEEQSLLEQGCSIMRAKVEEYGDKYVAEMVPKLCQSTPAVTDPQKCFNLVRADLDAAIRTTSDEMVNLCTQCLMNMTKPIFQEYGDNVVDLVGNASKIAREVNATLFSNCKMENVINMANLTAAWNVPLMDALRQTTNSTEAFEQALAQNGLTRLYLQREETLANERRSMILNIAGGSLFILISGLAVVSWRMHPRGKSQKLSPDKHRSRELISEETDLLPEVDSVLEEGNPIRR